MLLTTEVSEQRRAHADRDRFFSLSLDMLIVASPDGRLQRVNPAFGLILGYELSELLSREFIELVHEDDQERSLREFKRFLLL